MYKEWNIEVAIGLSFSLFFTSISIGPAKDVYQTLSKYRVNLACLRFGAGIKGKISDGWVAGTPAVTTW